MHGVLHHHGLSKKWASEGRQWLFVFQDTNPLTFRILCATLGVSAQNSYVMNSVAIPRIPGESIGGICRLVDEKGTNLTLNVEYNQLDPLLKETPTGGDVPDESGFSPYPGNINILLFRIPEYSRCLERTGGVVPEFVNPKWGNAEKTKLKSTTRLESLMQDFPRLCEPEDKVGMTQFDRWIAKTSVKNNLEDARKKKPPECALSAEADIYACNARLLQLLVRLEGLYQLIVTFVLIFVQCLWMDDDQICRKYLLLNSPHCDGPGRSLLDGRLIVILSESLCIIDTSFSFPQRMVLPFTMFPN